MDKSQKGFIPIGIIIAIILTTLVTAGAGYGVYKYVDIADKKDGLEEQTMEQFETPGLGNESEDDSEEGEKSVTEADSTVEHTNTPQSIAPIVPISTTKQPEDFEATCETRNKYVDEGDTIFASIEVPSMEREEYDGEWNKKYWRNGDVYDGAYFEISSSNAEDAIWATITRKIDGYSKTVVCIIVITDTNAENLTVVEPTQDEINEQTRLELRDIVESMRGLANAMYGMGNTSACQNKHSQLVNLEYTYQIKTYPSKPILPNIASCGYESKIFTYVQQLDILLDNL